MAATPTVPGVVTTPGVLPQVAPNGVTRRKFLDMKRKNPKMKGMEWQGYLAYVTRHQGAKGATQGLDLAKTFAEKYFKLPKGYMKQIDTRLGKMPPQYQQKTPAQLRAEATGLVMPLVDKQSQVLTDLLKKRSAEGTAAMTGYTNAYLSRLPNVQANINAIYDEARGLQGQAAGALGQFVQGQGAALSGELAAAEQAAGQTSTGSQAVAATGAGGAAATGAYDFSTMSRLIQQGAGSEAYAATLPAIAGAHGAETMKAFQSDLNRQLEEGIADINLQGQGDITDLYSDMMTRELGLKQSSVERRDAWKGARADAYSDYATAQADYRGAGMTVAAGLYGPMIRDAIAQAQDPLVTQARPPTQTTVKPGDIPPTRTEKIKAAWSGVRTDVANVIGQLMTRPQGVAGQNWKPPTYEQALRRAKEVIRLQMSGTGVSEGNIAAYARQVLAAQGVYPKPTRGTGTVTEEPRDYPGGVDPTRPVPGPPGGGGGIRVPWVPGRPPLLPGF